MLCRSFVAIVLAGSLGCTPPPATESAPAQVALTWRVLGRLDAETGYAPPDVAALGGQQVSIAGFMVPLDDDARQSAEFLLVPYFGACIHLPPPPPNQMIHVTMTSGAVPVTLTDAVVIEGELTVAMIDSPYGKVSYSLRGSSARRYK
jgi:uncharacterized protein